MLSHSYSLANETEQSDTPFPSTSKPSRENNKDKQESESQPPTSEKPEHDEHSNDFSGPPRPKQPVSDGNGAFWLIMISAIALVFLLSSYMQGSKTEIPFGELLHLIDQGASETNPKAEIKINEGPKTAKLHVRYTNLDNLVVSPYEIKGTVTREVLAPENKKTKTTPNVPFVSGRQGFNNDNNSLQERLEKNGFRNYRAETSPGFLNVYGPTLLMLAITIPLMIYIFRKISGSGAVAFGRSRGRQVDQEDIEVTFNDVAGVDEAVEELKEIVEFLRTPEKFQVLGGRIPRGVLLVGPPGTGKTILAKAVAGEANVPFFTLSGSDFVELYVGVGAARVRDLFQQAERKSPCIIFIDELDAIGKTRGRRDGADYEREQTLNALLVEMDGFGTNTGTIVMAATNRPETLDPALLRPGRFDRQVLVDRPDIQGREEILRVHTKKVKMDPSIDLKEIASITSGFVGADLAALVNEAALLAARTGKKMVTMEEFSEGVERITAGLQKRRRVILPEEKKRIAYHESGHALVAHLIPGTDPVHKVSIIPRGIAALGYTLQRPEDDRYLMTRTELESRIQVFMGGTIAEELVFVDFSTGAQNDLERATEIARSMVMDFGMSRLGRINFRESARGGFLGDAGFVGGRLHSEKTAWEIDQEIRRILESLYEKTKELLQSRRETLDSLSTILLEKEVLDTEELAEIIGTDASRDGEPVRF